MPILESWNRHPAEQYQTREDDNSQDKYGCHAGMNYPHSRISVELARNEWRLPNPNSQRQRPAWPWIKACRIVYW